MRYELPGELTEHETTVHIIPLCDLQMHEMTKDCWCKPDLDCDEFGWYCTHNSMDGREDFETGKRKLT